MPDFQLGGVGVRVGPDFTGFQRETEARLEVEERRLSPVEVKIVAELMAGFRKEAIAKAKAAMKGVTVKVDMEPNDRGFKGELRRQVAQATKGVTAEVPVTPVLRGGKRKFQADVRRLVAGSKVEVEIPLAFPKAATVKRDLRRTLTEASKGTEVKVPIEFPAARTIKTQLRKTLAEASRGVDFRVPIEVTNPRTLRIALRKAIQEAATGLVIRVPVELNSRGLTTQARAAAAAASAGLSISPVADMTRFRKEVLMRAQNTMYAASALSRVNVTANVRTIGQKGLDTLTGTLTTVNRLARNTAIGFGILGAAIAAVGIAGVKSAADFEFERDALKILLEDAVLGTAIFEDLIDMARLTTFELPNLAPVLRQLVVVSNTLGRENFGIDRLIPSVGIITDLGAALNLTGPQIEKIGLALSKIAGRGKLTAEELRSISKNAPGFNAIGAIAEKLGITIPEAFDEVRKGAVDSQFAIDTILQGMAEFPGAAGAAAREATQTLKGAWSNLPDVMRIAFFRSFDKHLPEITRLIGPEGPLLAAVEAVAPAFADAFLPVTQAVLDGALAMAPALRALVPVIVPVFDVLADLAGPIGKYLAVAFRRIGDSITVAGEAFADVVEALSPLIPTLGVIIRLIAGGLTTVFRTLMSSGAVTGFAKFWLSLVDVLEDVMPLITDVVSALAVGLVDAISSIDARDLVTSLVDFAGAASKILLALLPIIPAAAEVASILAGSFAPALEASVPLVEALVTILTPVAELLARLGPMLVIGVMAAKAAYGIGQLTVALMRMYEAGQKVREIFTGSGGRFMGIDTGKMETAFRGAVTAAASAAAGISGYFAGASEDAVTSIGSIVTAGASVATAFAISGPVGGAIAAATTAIGFFFGQQQKKAMQSRKAQEAFNRSVVELGTVFEEANIDQFSSDGAKTIAILKQLQTEFKDVNNEAARSAFGALGVDMAEVAVQAAKTEGSMAGVTAELNRAIDLKVDRLADGFYRTGESAGAFKDDVDAAFLSTQDWLIELIRTADAASGIIAARDLTGLEEWVRETYEGAEATKILTEMHQAFRDSLRANLADSPAAQYIASLPARTRAAIAEQTRLARVQQLVADEAERQRGAADRFADAYDGVRSALDKTVTAYEKWLDIQQGTGVTLAQVKVATADMARQYADLIASTDVGPWEKEQRRLLLVADAQREFGHVIAQFVSEASGNYDQFLFRAMTLRNELVTNLAAAFDGNKDKAAAFVDEILRIPDKATFEIQADTQPAIENVEDLQRRVSEYFLSDIRNKVFLDTADAEGKQAVIQNWIERYVKWNPKAKLFLDTLDAEGQAALMESLLLDLTGQDWTIPVKVVFDVVKNERVPALVAEAAVTGEPVIPRARGGLVTKPELALIGEAGPELVLPLNDPSRVAEILGSSGLVAGKVGAVGSLPKGVELGLAETLEEWKSTLATGLDSIEAMFAMWPASVEAATMPPWVAFMGRLEAVFTATLERLAGHATSGGASVVGALSAALEVGSAAVTRIVGDYGTKLAAALNPILEAIGSPTITVGAFREGGVTDPRIVPDGAYEVHVFGERGTHGEAYIPFDPGLRSSSRAIAEETVRRLGGKANWYREGGITGDTEGLNPEFARRLTMWSAAVGQPYNVTSGYRSVAEQTRLWNAYIAGVPGQAPAAPPGKSMHNFGLASDGPRWGGYRPSDFGLRFPMSYEPWHVEPVEARQWAAGMAPDAHLGFMAFPQPGDAGDHGQLSIVAKKAMQFGYDQALAWAGNVRFDSAPGSLALAGGAAAGEALATSWIRAAMAVTGVPETWLPGLLRRAQLESNYDPLAVNTWDSNAMRGDPSKGLMQVIGATFRRYALPGLTNIFDPVHNTVAAIRYIIDRYGDVSNLPQFGGYENGGLTTEQQLAWLSEKNKPELVLPLTKPERVRELADRYGLTEFLLREREQSRGGDDGPRVLVQMTPPAAAAPETYADGVARRLEPLLG